jgi:hypothetical protein
LEGNQGKNIAAIDINTGNATNWNPGADNIVQAIVASGKTIYAVGNFTTLGGKTRNYIGAVDATTGNATNWTPVISKGVEDGIYALALSGNILYTGGNGFIDPSDNSKSYFLAYPIDTTLTSIVTESESIPKSLLLFQNYPNPFNPSTVIRYQLSRSGFVMLKVYDILGHEIITLVNQLQQPGNYKVDFNARVLHTKALPSGVYFYRLLYNGIVITKKMLLVK